MNGNGHKTKLNTNLVKQSEMRMTNTQALNSID